MKVDRMQNQSFFFWFHTVSFLNDTKVREVGVCCAAAASAATTAAATAAATSTAAVAAATAAAFLQTDQTNLLVDLKNILLLLGVAWMIEGEEISLSKLCIGGILPMGTPSSSEKRGGEGE